jgi:hypothetical protein
MRVTNGCGAPGAAFGLWRTGGGHCHSTESTDVRQFGEEASLPGPRLPSRLAFAETRIPPSPIRRPMRPSHVKITCTLNLFAWPPGHIRVLFRGFEKGQKHTLVTYTQGEAYQCALEFESQRVLNIGK